MLNVELFCVSSVNVESKKKDICLYAYVFGAVGIVTCYGLDRRGIGVQIQVGAGLFSTSPRPVLGLTQPPVHRVPGGKAAEA
jgi:hypothetical protein